jgi:hypothetical protein
VLPITCGRVAAVAYSHQLRCMQRILWSRAWCKGLQDAHILWTIQQAEGRVLAALCGVTSGGKHVTCY